MPRPARWPPTCKRGTQLAVGSGEPRPRAVPDTTIAWEDFTERGAAEFDVAAVDKAFSILSSDTARTHAGRRALRLDTLSGSDVWLTYPHTRDAGWDLVARRFLSFAMYVDDAQTKCPPGFPRIRLGRGSAWIQLEPRADVLGQAVKSWTRLFVPLAADTTWTRSEVNNPDLSRIDWIEICVAPENRGSAVWFDAVGFEPPRAVAPFDATQARRYQQAWADYLGVPVEETNSIGIQLVLIPPGEFDMGESQEEVDRLMGDARDHNAPPWWIARLPSEAPRHRVRITRPFYLGKFEVTVNEFREFVEVTGHETSGESDARGSIGLDVATGAWAEMAFLYDASRARPDTQRGDRRTPPRAHRVALARAAAAPGDDLPDDGLRA